LDKQISLTQETIAELSPIFERYIKEDNSLSATRVFRAAPIQPAPIQPAPINQHIVDLLHIYKHQEMVLRQLTEVMVNMDMSQADLQELMIMTVDKSESLIDQLITRVPLDEIKPTHVFVTIPAFSKVVAMQGKIFSTVRSLIPFIKPVNMEAAITATAKLTALEYRLPEISHQLKLTLEKSLRVGTSEVSTFTPSAITGLVNMTWGAVEAMDNKAIVQIAATRSLEQLFWLYKQLDGVTRDQALITAVNSNIRNPFLGAETFTELINKYNRIHVSARVEGASEPRSVSGLTTSVHELVKHLLWPHYRRQQPVAGVEKSTVDAVIDISDVNNKMDLILMTPTETDLFVDLPTCPGLKLATTPALTPLTTRVHKFMPGTFSPATCMVAKDAVKTFDKVIYKLTDFNTTCAKVLAMDCSEEKSFAITLTPTKVSRGQYKVDVASGDSLISVHPHLLTPVVKVNNVEIKLKDEQPFNIFVRLDGVSVLEASIVRRGLRVEVTLPRTGVFLVVEGSFIEVKASRLFQKRLCGLCSNFDGQMAREFEGPREEVYSEESAFAFSYQIHVPSCKNKIPIF